MLLRTSSRSMWRVWVCSSSKRTFVPSVCLCAAPYFGASIRPWPSQTPPTIAGPSSAPPPRKSLPSCPITSRYRAERTSMFMHSETTLYPTLQITFIHISATVTVFTHPQQIPLVLQLQLTFQQVLDHSQT